MATTFHAGMSSFPRDSSSTAGSGSGRDMDALKAARLWQEREHLSATPQQDALSLLVCPPDHSAPGLAMCGPACFKSVLILFAQVDCIASESIKIFKTWPVFPCYCSDLCENHNSISSRGSWSWRRHVFQRRHFCAALQGHGWRYLTVRLWKLQIHGMVKLSECRSSQAMHSLTARAKGVLKTCRCPGQLCVATPSDLPTLPDRPRLRALCSALLKGAAMCLFGSLPALSQKLFVMLLNATAAWLHQVICFY